MRRMSGGKGILSVFLALVFLCCVDAAQKMPRKPTKRPPAPPRAINAVRVGPGVIGVDWTPRKKSKAPAGYLLYRSENSDGPYEVLARRPGDRPYFLDAKTEPETLHFYKVAAFQDESAPSAQAGPTCAWDSDQLIPNGSFELDKPGLVTSPKCPLWWLRRAYNSRTPVVIQPGGPDGERCVEIQSADTSVSGGLHSMLIPMIEGETWKQTAWSKYLPGARTLVGRCFYNADRKTVRGKGIKRAYTYASAGPARRDGWRLYKGGFTAPRSTCYVQVWVIGFKARNTFWFDGATMTDVTAQNIRKFDFEALRKGMPALLQTAVGKKYASALGGLDAKIQGLGERMKTELDTLSPLEYRRLFVDRYRTQRQYVEQMWVVKTLALLEE